MYFGTLSLVQIAAMGHSGQLELHLLKGTWLQFFSLSSLLFISSFSLCCSLSVCAQMCLSGSCEQIQYSVPLGCSLLKLSSLLWLLCSSIIFSFTTALFWQQSHCHCAVTHNTDVLYMTPYVFHLRVEIKRRLK